MPYASKRQQRWAHATRQPFARRWDKETDFSTLKDDAAMAHGPGGLLATPGLGGRKKWGKRLKAKQIAGNLYRGDDGKFQAGGAGGSSTSTPAKGRTPKRGDTLPEVKPLKQPKGRGGKRAPAKPKQPAKTPEQRQQEQQAKREAATAEQRATRDRLLTDAGIDANTQGALIDARDGNTLTPANGAKLAEMGLAEQSADGSYRLTPAGISAVDSAMRGDAGRLQTTLSKARDAASKQPKTGAPKKGGGGGKAPKEKPDKDAAAAQKKAENRNAVKEQMANSDTGLSPSGFDAFTSFADGGKLTPEQAKGLTEFGLLEGDPPRLTQAGRAAQNAIDRGDYRDAVDAIERGKQRTGDASKRTADQQARQAERDAQKRQQLERLRKRAQAGVKLTQSERDRLTDAGMAEEDGLMWRPKSFVVFKDGTGQRRWLSRTTTAYQDRDKEIIAEAALDRDSQRMMTTKSFGPLRWWHVGAPDEFSTDAPWGPGIDLGWCDYSIVIGRTRVESGTFKSEQLAEQVAKIADKLEMSPGFFHPLDQPSGGVFTDIRTFERSLVPTRHARASNLFTGFTVKESRMTPEEMERRFKTVINELGLSPEQASELSSQLVATEKAAQSQGIAFKSTDAAPEEITINGVVYTVKAAPPPEMVEAAVTEEVKADPMVDTMAEEVIEEPDDEMGADVIGNLTWDEFAAKLTEVLAPVLKMQDMVKSITEMGGELKSMYGGATTKDDARAKELATLKEQQTQLAAKIAQIEGRQPATILPADVAAALKSAGPATPPEADPTKPQIPNDPNRPMAGLTAQIMPELYYDGANGWQQRPAN